MMTVAKKISLSSIAIGILVVLNLALISVILLPRISDDTPPMRRDGRLNELFSEKLSFSAEQKEALTTLNTKHRERMSALQPKISQKRAELFDLIRQENVDPKEIEQLTAEMGAIISELEASNYLFFSSIRALCNDTQKQDFDLIVQEIRNRRNLDNGPNRSRRFQRGDTPRPRRGQGPPPGN